MIAISVVIPALDEEKLLPQLLAQLPADLRARHGIEVILSDGGSSDATREIAAAAHCILALHAGTERQTIAGGRNSGAALAGGDILVFLNADVRLGDAGRFFAALPSLFADPGVAGATCPVQVFPEEETRFDRAFHVAHNTYVRLLNAIGEGMGRGECQVLRRELFERLGGYNAAMAAGEDFDLFRRLRAHGRIRMIPGAVAYESPRRFRQEGYLRIVWGWTKNALAVMVHNRSSSQTWDPVR